MVAELASHGALVTALTHTRPGLSIPGADSVRRADLRHLIGLADVVNEIQPDAICHLAALATARESFAKAIEYYDVNVTGTINLLRAVEAARLKRPPKVIFASTNAVYGSGKSGALTEDDPPNPESPYAASKLAAEQLISGYARTGAIGASILRCFNIAGATADGYGDPDQTRIISNVIRAANGEIPHVTVNGDGSAVREFTHVLDVAEAVRLALRSTEAGYGEVFNIGTGVGLSMMEVIRAGERITGRSIEIVHRPPAHEPHTLVANVSKARASLGWKARRSSIDRILADAWKATNRGQRQVKAR